MGEPGVSSGHLMIEQPAASAAAILRTAWVTGKCNFVGAGAHELGHLAQDLAALEGRHFAPGLEALVDGRERPIEVAPGDVAQRTDRLAGGGIDHVLRLCTGGFDPVAIDVMSQGMCTCRLYL